jgi:hypothetical protein
MRWRVARSQPSVRSSRAVSDVFTTSLRHSAGSVGIVEARREHSLYGICAFALAATVITACGGTAGPAAITSGSSAMSKSSDPLRGTWHTSRLTARQVVSAFQRAGGTRAAGETFFKQIGQGNTKRYVVISIHLSDGSFTEYESSDGSPADEESYLASYRESGPTMTLTSTNPGDTCVGTYRFSISNGTLRFHVLHQCHAHDAPYNTTLFATYPYTRGRRS